MNEKLRTYIFCTLISENMNEVDKNKYERVIRALDTDYYVNDIISYIMRSLEVKCVREKIILSDENILNLLSFEFCIERACEYLDFLQNDHEYAHECEFECGMTR